MNKMIYPFCRLFYCRNKCKFCWKMVLRAKDPTEGFASVLEKYVNCERDDGKTADGDNNAMRTLARRILIGRKLKKAALLSPSTVRKKVRKLDRQKYAMETMEEVMENGNKQNNEEEEMELEEWEVEQTINELRMRESQKDTSQMMLKYGLPSTSDYTVVTQSVHFPQTSEYAIRLTVFRDLWRKGFYLTSGLKFGCDYLAYEKPPGEQHSKYLVICADANNPLKPFSLIGASRVSTQVKKRVLLAIVSVGTLLPHYIEMNWWKGDGIDKIH